MSFGPHRRSVLYVVRLGGECCWPVCLTTESVQGASLAFEGIDDVHGSDGLPLGVFGVGDGVPDDVLEEDLEHASGLLVDESGDALDSTSAGETADGGLGDALDVITQDLAVTLGASLAEPLSSLAASCHGDEEVRWWWLRW